MEKAKIFALQSLSALICSAVREGTDITPATVEGSTKGDPFRQPLPSVGIPLLRDELRAGKMRVMIVAGVLGLLGLLTLGIIWLSSSTEQTVANVPASALATVPVAVTEVGAKEDEKASPVAAAAIKPTIAADEMVTDERVETTFGKAKGFRAALVTAGVGAEECAKLEVALKGVLDFRRLHPEDKMVLHRNAGRLQRFEYHVSPIHYVVARRQGEIWSAEKKERPQQTFVLVRGGSVMSSLGDALSKEGLGRSLVGEFVNVFEGKANFATDARRGDSFRIVVEEKRIEGRVVGFGNVLALEYVGGRTGTLRAYYYEHRNKGEYYDDEGRALHGSWLRSPCRYDRISSPFDPKRMHPILKRTVPHNGIDFAASTGTPVWAGADGEIIWAGPKGPNGNLVGIRHADGYESFHAHLHRIQRGIRPGVKVTQKQLIGSVGSTGRSTGPHLHFGLKRHKKWVDPLTALRAEGKRLPSNALKSFYAAKRKLDAELAQVSVTPPVLEGPPPTEDSKKPGFETLD